MIDLHPMTPAGEPHVYASDHLYGHGLLVTCQCGGILQATDGSTLWELVRLFCQHWLAAHPGEMPLELAQVELAIGLALAHQASGRPEEVSHGIR